MTTINNSENLIEKVGGIERAREIVEGAPELSTDYVFWTSKTRYINRLTKEVYLDSTHEWFSANIMVLNLMHCLDDLRTAIAEHDSAQLCIGCGSPDLHKGGEIKEPKMCLDCFAEMVGFTRTSNGFVESDDVTDIRNHLIPSTVVVDL